MNRERPYNYCIVRAIRDYDDGGECKKSIENTYSVAKEIYAYVSLSLRENKNLDVNILLHDLLIIMDDDDLACPKSNGSWEGLKNVLNADGLTLLD